MDDWWEPYVDAISQPFNPWNGTKWCYEEKPKGGRQKKSYGLMLSKIFKAASSTSAGVTLRIAHRMAKRLGHDAQKTPCLSYYEHYFSLLNNHSSRDPSTHFFRPAKLRAACSMTQKISRISSEGRLQFSVENP